MEEVREEQQRGALIEAVGRRSVHGVRVEQGAATAGVGVLFEHGDLKAGVLEASGGTDAADASAWKVDWLALAELVRNEMRIPMTMAVFRPALASPIEVRSGCGVAL